MKNAKPQICLKIVYYIYNAIKGPSSKQNECGKQYLIMPLYLLYTDRMHLSAAALSLTRLPCRYVLEKYVCGCIFLHVYDKNKLGHKSFLRFQQIQTPH